MRNRFGWKSLMLINLAAVALLILFAIGGNRTVSVITEKQIHKPQNYFIIDAGHGGVDGGATSCNGVLESRINLDIALRLDDLLHLLGMHTIMIRTEDVSIYTEGESIASKKVSDLKNRVRIINQTNNAILVSIHQNHFYDQRYSGAQVFYAKTAGSSDLAQKMQTQLVNTLNPDSNRQIKKASGIYLLENIKCPAILIECGFLSNPQEETKLLSDSYQKNICCVIASILSSYPEVNAVT